MKHSKFEVYHDYIKSNTDNTRIRPLTSSDRYVRPMVANPVIDWELVERMYGKEKVKDFGKWNKELNWFEADSQQSLMVA